MSRRPRRPVPTLLALVLSAAVVSAQGNSGIIFSEIAHGPTLPPVGGLPMPSYIELVNVQIANPVVPPPVPIGSATAGNATLTSRVGAQAPVTFPIPIGSLVGGNVQPPPAPQPPFLPPSPPVFLISSGPFPPGVVPPGISVVFAPALFSGLNALLGAPGVPIELCFNNPATGQGDRIHLGAAAGSPCSAAPFNNTLTFQPANGLATRWTYVDSNTDIDFDNGFSPSPGWVNPQMAHVNGFFFGTPTSPAAGGAPLVITGTTAGTLTFLPNAIVKSVHFVNQFLDRKITNPAFDPVINAPVTMTANFSAQPASVITQPGFLPGLQILNESLMITATTPAGQGVLGMSSGVSSQVVSLLSQSYLAAGEIRPERLFSDLAVASTPSVLGPSPTPAEIDVLPASTGGGNVWCRGIAFDLAGNEYRAMVKNWPPVGSCLGPPLIGLGTDGSQSFTLIDLCFNPGSMIANLFSASPVATCGGGLLPPAGGICPDAYTIWILTPPQLGSLPFFPTADLGGLYYFHVPSNTLPALAGVTFEAIGVEYTLAGTILQQSGVSSITL